jgi:hypothetical protein
VSYKSCTFSFFSLDKNFSMNSCDVDVTVPRLHLSVVQKHTIYVCGTKLAELNGNLIHSYACTFSNYQCVFSHLTDAIMIANLTAFSNVVPVIT